MAPFVNPLSEADVRDLSAYFAAQQPRPPNGGGTIDETGRRIYTSGDPSRGVPPCQGCHGSDGRGVKPSGPGDRVPWHSFPTLAGQYGDYLVLQLQAFRDASRGGTTHSAIMRDVARNMDDAAMRAVATYIATALPAH
jgi:cytochrome c553